MAGDLPPSSRVVVRKVRCGRPCDQLAHALPAGKVEVVERELQKAVAHFSAALQNRHDIFGDRTAHNVGYETRAVRNSLGGFDDGAVAGGKR